MIGLGVSSFSHFDGVHFQNAPKYEDYLRGLENGELPLWRALRLMPKQKLIREMILLLKTGALDTKYFRRKFDVDVWQEFRPVYEQLSQQNMLQRHNGQHERIELTRAGLQQVDHLLPEFFEPELKAVRYA